MLRIGLLGGTSYASSADYYRLLNRLTRERVGDLSSCECILYSVDFADIEVMQASGCWADAGQRLAEVHALEAAGAKLLWLCRNTIHRVSAAVRIPLLHTGDATADAVRRAGLGTLGARA